MVKRTQSKLMAVVGTVAMLLALMLAPIAAGAAGGRLVTTGAAGVKVAGPAHLHAMPCHEPATKQCPQKSACPDVITCMAKCAQSLATAPLGDAPPMPMVWLSLAAPVYAAEPRDQLIPPLLRPPIV